MDLKKHTADEVQSGQLSLKDFNSKYLTKNQPVLVREMASQWPSTSKWNYQFFIDHIGEELSLITVLRRKPQIYKESSVYRLKNNILEIRRNDELWSK